MYVSLTRPGWYLLVIGKLMEELIDVADAEKSGGIQVWQNLNQDLRWQSTEKVIRHHYKEVTPVVFMPPVVQHAVLLRHQRLRQMCSRQATWQSYRTLLANKMKWPELMVSFNRSVLENKHDVNCRTPCFVKPHFGKTSYFHSNFLSTRQTTVLHAAWLPPSGPTTFAQITLRCQKVIN